PPRAAGRCSGHRGPELEAAPRLRTLRVVVSLERLGRRGRLWAPLVPDERPAVAVYRDGDHWVGKPLTVPVQIEDRIDVSMGDAVGLEGVQLRAGAAELVDHLLAVRRAVRFALVCRPLFAHGGWPVLR